MRVGVMDADPQSTITLYFVGGEGLSQMPTEETPSMVDFAGLFHSEGAPYTDHSAETLDSFFEDVLAGASIGAGARRDL